MRRTHNFPKRFGFFLCLVIFQAVLLLMYWRNVDFINNFKISYIKEIYLPMFRFPFSPFPIVKKNDQAHAVPVLLYHSIIEKPDGANVTLHNFVSQMMALK